MTEIDRMSDEALALLLRESGDQRYFSVLAKRHEQKILKKCRSYVENEVGKDLTQEVLIKLFLRIKDFRNDARFSTWLFTIIHSTCIDYLRRNKKNVHGVITEKLADELGEMVDSDEEVENALSEQILEELLEQITPEEKMILLLKYKEKHSLRDIQQTLNLSESAIKMRLKRAREKVNRLYQKYRK